MIEKEKLDMIVDYAMKIKAKKIAPEYSTRVKDINRAIDPDFSGYQIFSYMIDLMGFNAFPNVVKDEDFEKCVVKKACRGDTNVQNLAQLLADFDYHYGTGNYCNGIYGTNVIAFAKFYATDDGDVVYFGIDKNAKIIDHDALEEINNELIVDKKNAVHRQEVQELCDYLNTLPKRAKKCMIDLFVSDPAKLAIVLGYDVVSMKSDYSGKRILYSILNRNSMVVSESEYMRIVNQTEVYKDGHIVDKPDDNFLLE